MKLKAIYELAVKMGTENDPRGKAAVAQDLKRAKDAYARLSGAEKDEFDRDKLVNPFPDTRILNGDPDTEVKAVLAGIDMEIGEVLLADRLRDKGKRIDLLMSHHPEARALANLFEVMPMQADIWQRLGVPINVGDALIQERMKEVKLGFLPLNHTRPVDAARLLGIPFLCTHTATDNLVTTYLQKALDKRGPETLGEIVDELKREPEYQWAAKESIGPVILVGSKEKRCGKVMVDMTGGTGGPKEAIARLTEAGVGTVVTMHMSEKSRKAAEKSHMNVVIAGHASSDSIGMNLLLDQVEKNGVNILTCSGLPRVKRR